MCPRCCAVPVRPSTADRGLRHGRARAPPPAAPGPRPAGRRYDAAAPSTPWPTASGPGSTAGACLRRGRRTGPSRSARPSATGAPGGSWPGWCGTPCSAPWSGSSPCSRRSPPPATSPSRCGGGRCPTAGRRRRWGSGWSPTWAGVPLVVVMGLAWAAATVLVMPPLARRQLRIAQGLLAHGSGDLSLRVAELTRTRAEALDAHVTELRRIERALHDGAQNRLVATNVLLGAARRSLATGRAGRRPPARPGAGRRRAGPRRAARGGAQHPAAGAERPRASPPPFAASRPAAPSSARSRSTYRPAARPRSRPPSTSRSPRGSPTSPGTARRGTRGSRSARRDDVLTATVRDDGRGGAREGAGTGLAGIRRRVEAMDGRWSLASPPGGPTVVEVTVPCGS